MVGMAAGYSGTLVGARVGRVQQATAGAQRSIKEHTGWEIRHWTFRDSTLPWSAVRARCGRQTALMSLWCGPRMLYREDADKVQKRPPIILQYPIVTLCHRYRVDVQDLYLPPLPSLSLRRIFPRYFISL